jgi:hypothetical protein
MWINIGNLPFGRFSQAAQMALALWLRRDHENWKVLNAP